MNKFVDSFFESLVEDEERMNFTIRLFPSFGLKLDDLARKIGVSRAVLMRRFVEVAYEELREPLEAAAAMRAEQREASTKAYYQQMRAKREAKIEAKAS